MKKSDCLWTGRTLIAILAMIAGLAFSAYLYYLLKRNNDISEELVSKHCFDSYYNKRIKDEMPKEHLMDKYWGLLGLAFLFFVFLVTICAHCALQRKDRRGRRLGESGHSEMTRSERDRKRRDYSQNRNFYPLLENDVDSGYFEYLDNEEIGMRNWKRRGKNHSGAVVQAMPPNFVM
jgi:hypothetical protein